MSAALVPLTEDQRQLALLIRTNPAEAFAEIGRRLTIVLETNRPAKIGQTEVVTGFDGWDNSFDLTLYTDRECVYQFGAICDDGGLSESLRKVLSRGMNDSYKLVIEGSLVVEDLRLSASGLKISAIENTYFFYGRQVSPEVFAALFDMLEPQGIGPDLEEGGEPAVAAVAESADSLIPLSAEEAELARLINEDPEEAWKRIEERFVPGEERPALEKYGQARIGGTVVTIDKYSSGLSLILSGDRATLESFLQACGGRVLSEDFETALERGMSGDHTLEISADFSRAAVAKITAIIQKEDDIVNSRTVSPEVFATLFGKLQPQGEGSAAREEEVGRREVQVYPSDGLAELAGPAVVGGSPEQDDRSRLVGLFDRLLERSARTGSAPAVARETVEEPQASPPAGEAAPSPERQLANLIRTDPAGAFAEIREKVAPLLAAGDGEARVLNRPGRASIGNTEVGVDMNERSLALSLETDYVNLALFIKSCGDENLSRAFTEALAKGISGYHRLRIEAKLADSGVTINAKSTRWDGLKQVNDRSGKVSPAVFAALVGMLKPVSSIVVQAKKASDRPDGDKRGHKFRALEIGQIRRGRGSASGRR